MKNAEKIAINIASELLASYKEAILIKTLTPEGIDHDLDFWNNYKEACIDAYEAVMNEEFGESGIELIEDAENIVFKNKFYL